MKPYIYIWCLVSKWDRFTRSRISKERGKIFQKYKKGRKQRICAKKRKFPKITKIWKTKPHKIFKKKNFNFEKKRKIQRREKYKRENFEKFRKTAKNWNFLKNDEFNFWGRYWRNWQGIVWTGNLHFYKKITVSKLRRVIVQHTVQGWDKYHCCIGKRSYAPKTYKILFGPISSMSTVTGWKSKNINNFAID